MPSAASAAGGSAVDAWRLQQLDTRGNTATGSGQDNRRAWQTNACMHVHRWPTFVGARAVGGTLDCASTGKVSIMLTDHSPTKVQMMKPVRQILLAMAVVLLLGHAAVRAADDASAWDKTKAMAHTQKDAAVAEAKRLIAAIDKQMAEVSKQAKQTGADAKAAHRQNMADLAAKKKEAEASLAKLQASSSNAWDATKEGFGKAYQDLHKAYEKAVDSAKK
jgi:hypothetical protein